MSSESSSQPLQPSQPAVARVPWNPWLGVLFAVVIYYVAQLFGGLSVAIYPLLHGWSHAQMADWLTTSVTAQFVYIVLTEAAILGSLSIFLKKFHCTFATIGLKRPRWHDVAYGLMAVPAYFLIYLLSVGLISHFVPGLDINQQQDVGFSDVHGVLALSMTFISLVVLPPLAEEIMVRGFLYSSLKKAVPTLWAVLLTSLIFAAAHLPEGGAAGPLYIAALDTFILSLVLIFLRERTGSLWASITLHAIKNGVAFVSLFVLHVK